MSPRIMLWEHISPGSLLDLIFLSMLSMPETALANTPTDQCIDSRVSPWLSAIAYPLGSNLLLPSFFGNIEVHGQSNLPTSGPVILAPVHRSRWDALIVPHVTGPRATGRYLRFMVTADEVKGLQGWFIRRLGGFPINPRRPGIASFRYSMELLRQGEMMVIFPEGGIFRDAQVHPLKSGLARLAIQAEQGHPNLGVKIVPIYLCYSRALPVWGSKVQVSIGAPLSVARYITGSPKKNARKLTTDLHHHLAQLGEQVQPDEEIWKSAHAEEVAQL